MDDDGNPTDGGAGGNSGGTGGPGHGATTGGSGAGAGALASGGQADCGSAGPQAVEAQGEGDGDGLASRLRGHEGGTGTQAAAETGDMEAGRSERTDGEAATPVGAGIGADPGGPGGMGGVRGGMPNPDHRPNGGVSPIQQSSGDNDRH